MLILGLESSAKIASCALGADGRRIALYTQDCGLTHSSTLLPMAEDMLRNCGVELRALTHIAVAAGPGSFTGVRI
ncbi:MAG: tRNA (adenosine(37)-N6)-threonylcarbamoyltransferase complex dimerization subunit type 1 TsaB, partial [Oscillospiraceae bacterium]|nr:tRNA (adenosine(37)-N6)-threonylcarbamoyltransferase complex dimerization subunit type 1 TsaB [Oscillospiraceae bacterium]